MGGLLAISLLFLFTQSDAQHAPALGPRCSAARINVACGTHEGIFWRVGNSNFQVARTADAYTPVSPPSDQHTMVIVCNLGSIKVNGSSVPLRKPIIPTLLHDVRARATVSVVIFNSANVEVTSGFFLHRANLNRLHQAVPALVGTVLNGSIGKNATISVKVEKSANVHLRSETTFFSRDSHLVAPMIKDSADLCVSAACVDVELVNSANVVGKGEKTRVLLSNGHLVSRIFNASCLNGGSFFVDIRESASVKVDSIVFGRDSTLVSSMVSIGGPSNKAVLSFGVADAVKVKVTGSLEMCSGKLFEGVLETSNIQQSLRVLLRMENVANVAAASFSTQMGAIMGDLVLLSKSISCQATVFLSRCASITATKIDGVKAIDTIVNIQEDAEHTSVNVTLLKSANIMAGNFSLRESDNILNKVIVNKGKVLGGKYSTHVINLANLHAGTLKGSVSEVNGVLVKELVDLGHNTKECKVNVFAKQVANILCNAQGTGTVQMGANSKLLAHAVQLRGSDATIRTNMDVCANSFMPLSNSGNLSGDLISARSAFKLLELNKSFVSHQFKCDAVSLIDDFRF